MTDWRISFSKIGGPEVLEVEQVAAQSPGADEVVVRHEAIGLNFIDTYHRSGLYPVPLPSGLGSEAAGVIEQIGKDVVGFARGDRVGYATSPLGAYSTARAIRADLLVPLPPTISSEVAAASLIKGTTAEVLVEQCAKMRSGQSALVHAAAGGVGSILVQWLQAIGVSVIAHVGNETKASYVRALGCERVFSGPLEELSDHVRATTDGQGVDVVFDGVGAASWAASINSAKVRGLIVSYGNASGAVPPVSLLDIMSAGSLFITRPSLRHYLATASQLRESTNRLFALLATGAINVQIGQVFELSHAEKAHAALEGRQTVGSSILKT